MQYTWADAQSIFEHGRGPYLQSLKGIESAVEQRARNKMGDISFGGMVVSEGQYAEQALRPYFFQDSTGGTQLTTDFRENTGSTGWQSILYNDASDSGTINENHVWGLAGFAFLEGVQRMTELRIIRGDTTFAVINVEEAKALDQPFIVFDTATSEEGAGQGATGSGPDDMESFIFDKDNTFTLEANFRTSGDYYLKPIGTARVPQQQAIDQTP